MNYFFQKRININHTYRDYEDEFSSKNDIFLPEGENLQKYRRIKTLYGKIVGRINDRDRAPSKNTLRRHEGQAEAESVQDDPLHTPVSAIFNFHGKRFVFCKKSIFGMDQDSTYRRFAVYVTESIYFELFTVILIIFNSVLLGLKNYSNGNRDELDDFYDIIEPIVLGYNLIEALLKSVARGFNVDESSYIRQNMNAIDFLIATTGFSYILFDVLRYISILRLPRVVIFLEKFKLFRTISDMTSLIFDSILPLSSVFLMILFFYSIFAILGLHIYVGSLSSRCKYTPAPVNGYWQSDPNITRLCGEEFKCPIGEYCGSVFDYNDDLKPGWDQDLSHYDFNFGLTNFDSYPNALFSVFIINHGSWTKLLTNLADSKNMILAVIYCTVNYLVCNIFVFQIAVAVMLDNFERKRKVKKPGIANHLERTEKIDEKANSLMKKV
jgi:Ion transport protein